MSFAAESTIQLLRDQVVRAGCGFDPSVAPNAGRRYDFDDEVGWPVNCTPRHLPHARLEKHDYVWLRDIVVTKNHIEGHHLCLSKLTRLDVRTDSACKEGYHPLMFDRRRR